MLSISNTPISEESKAQESPHIEDVTGSQTNNIKKIDEKCDICKNYVAKYKCPKCSLPYCSLKCYNNTTINAKHSNCLEIFSKENIDQALKRKVKSNKSIREMQELLKKNML